MFPTFTPKCTLMLTGGLFSEIRLDYCGQFWAEFRGTLVLLIDVGGRSYAVFSGATCADTRIRSSKPELEFRTNVSGNLLQSRGKAERLQIVFVVIGGRLRCTVQRSSSLSSSSSSRVVYESEAAEEQCRLEAVKNFVIWSPAASWGTSKPALLLFWGIRRAGI